MTEALIVYPDGRRVISEIEPDLETLQGIVGGNIEYVFVQTGVHAYVNEEGKIMGLPANPTATRLCRLHGIDVIAGTAVFLGDGPEGEEGDLPEVWRNVVMP